MAVKKSGVSSGIKAVLLVGGFGTRLRPLTDSRPKSFLPVLNRPFLEHTIAYLKHYGIKDIILTLNYLPDVIQDSFGDGKKYGVRLTYCIEKEPLGTAGAVKNAESYLDGTFLVLNGDIFTDLDLADMLACHRGKKASATISLTWVANPSAFGVVETDTNQKVQRFIEKPPPGTETTNWINAGIYVLEPEVLKQIPPGQPYMFERGLFPRLLDIGRPVFGYTCEGYWLDMGTPQKYYAVNMDLLLKKTKSPLAKSGWNNGVYYGKNTEIHPTAEIKAPVLLGADCKIGRGVSIKGPVVLGRGCLLQDGASVEKTILWDNVAIGKNASLYQCIIGNDIVIADNQKLKDCVVTSSRTVPLSF